MSRRTDQDIQRLTTELRLSLAQEEIEPSVATPTRLLHEHAHAPHWRVSLEKTNDESLLMDLEFDRETILGRLNSDEQQDFVILFPEIDTEVFGVSRTHAVLSPTSTALYVIDLGSTNGTRLNGRRLGPKIPYVVVDGDQITLGRLECLIRILEQPSTQNTLSKEEQLLDPQEALPLIIRAINSQLTLQGVIQQTIQTVCRFIPTDEISIWLVDEQTGELFLHAAHGMENNGVLRMPVQDTLAGKVVRSGTAARLNAKENGDLIKLKTGYLAKGVIYVPIKVVDTTVGVISVVHREHGRLFVDEDEQMIRLIADAAAVAIQNARAHEAVKRDVVRRTNTLSAIGFAMKSDLLRLTNAIVGYAGLLQLENNLREDVYKTVDDIHVTGGAALELLERLIIGARLPLEKIATDQHCDLYALIHETVQEHLQAAAEAKQIELSMHVSGAAYTVLGDPYHLRRALFNLIENAIKFTPPGGSVKILLTYTPLGIALIVADTGPGIPERELPYLFNCEFRVQESGSIGLGLEVARAIIEAHLGTIEASNLPHGGLEVIVKLPNIARVRFPDSEEGR
ncbi:MAG: FHA domain-containing protein [Anaerolineae bacterium]|nr:FHA domain-containing protein [Anaerolineae bacterium]